jgi:ABC-type transport system substrate-binding protein
LLKKQGLLILGVLLLSACNDLPWNDPYPYEDPTGNTLYMAFTERPNHLDPARSYTSSEWPFLCQIVEPPLQYNYIKRPYELEPLTAVDLPTVKYYDKQDKELGEKDKTNIAYTVYEIRIKPGIYFAPSPAFVSKYHDMAIHEARLYHNLSDFKEQATKELSAEDYVYQIKRLAEPSLNCPIYGVMSHYIEGLKELRDQLKQIGEVEQDLRNYTLSGVKVLDRYTYSIRIKGHYPQFRFWLAMPFFSPVPWEVAHFFAQPIFSRNNISLDWYPVGTGPYCLSENNPERRMVLERNPGYRESKNPIENPKVQKVVYTLEKESVPFWNKFLQGYYDISAIQSDNFASAIQFNAAGEPELTDVMKKKGIQLRVSVSSSVFYWGFNMLDDTVGGYTENARKIRQAISMAFDVPEYIDIFLNGRGLKASGPIPEDIFGFEAQAQLPLKNIKGAKELLREAGYPNGLTVYFDAMALGSPDEVATQQWLIKQLQSIGVTIVFRTTDYNRFQDKVRTGTAQMFFFGWNADYPDPENFLFLFYGPNGSAHHGGENTSNYQNAEYDQLFEKMETLEDGPERFKLIQQMVSILQKDAPWVWGFYPQTFGLYHEWMQALKASGLINNTLKYVRLNPLLRAQKRVEWNQPHIWPLIIVMCIVGILSLIWLIILFKGLKKGK